MSVANRTARRPAGRAGHDEFPRISARFGRWRGRGRPMSSGVDQPAGVALGEAASRHQSCAALYRAAGEFSFLPEGPSAPRRPASISTSSCFSRRFSSSRLFRRCASDVPTQPVVFRLPAIENLLADPLPAADLCRRRPALLFTSTPMICASLNRLFLIVRLLMTDSHIN
jgi:hypothetical protein